MLFSDILSGWYDENRRDLPWRGETDPYKIWVSEIILQQTRVLQGWDYYFRFIETFPDVVSLARAPVEKVLKVWQGLGYYSRARNMHAAAKTIIEQHAGIFPSDYKDIITLKGVGEYTAAAIASIAFGVREPAVDGNVARIICRIFGIFDDINRNATKRAIAEKCRQLMLNIAPGDFNQAMMDFGSIICTPKSPHCDLCPFLSNCHAYRYGVIDTLPVKIKNIKIKKRFFHYFCFLNEQRVIVQQREGNDIWNSLFELPLLETPESSSILVQQRLESFSHVGKPHQSVTHQLTHQTIIAHFYLIPVKEFPPLEGNQQVLNFTAIQEIPFPKIIADFLHAICN